MTSLRHIVTSKDKGKRLDVVLASVDEHHSRQQVQMWIKERLVMVNNHHVKASYTCDIDDVITWTIPAEEQIMIKSEKIKLDIIYEDDELIVINKQKGMLTHPTQTVHSGTLVNALLYHTDELSDLGGPDRPGIVHRLDKDTSGLLIIAKNNKTHAYLVEQFKQHNVFRQYEAIVHDVIGHDHGVIKAPIGRNTNHRLEMTVTEAGKVAETHFSVMHRFKNHTLIRCELKTGRTHQIRVHMKHIDHPIVGDTKYGHRKEKAMGGQLLFARKIGFNHPTHAKWVSFRADRPQEISQMLDRLKRMT